MDYKSRYVLTSVSEIKKVANGVLCAVEEQFAISEERRYDIMLVINELLVNSFEHAQPNAQQPVVFCAHVAGSHIYIGVTDGGSGFAYGQATLQTEESTLYKERGRGLMIVRALCEEIKYNCRGNSVEVKMAL